MNRLIIQASAGIVAVGALAAVVGLSESARERRHAERPNTIVEGVLALAKPTSTDLLYDLECGDGGVVVAAAKRFGTRSVCIDLYGRRIEDAKSRARRAGVENLISFTVGDWQKVDVSPATIVVVYLTNPTGHAANYPLRGKLTRELRPGARIVAYRPDLGDWTPAETISIDVPRNEPIKSVKLWVADGLVRPWLQ